MIRVGLRFLRADARVLTNLAERVRSGDVKGDLATFLGAADAARTGEPFIVLCKDVSEAHMMADLYSRLGVGRPVVDELTGLRPAK